MTTTDSAASRMPRAAARCATIARKALKIVWLIVTGFAGLLVGQWMVTKVTSLGLPPGEWRQVMLRILAAIVAVVVFWITYDLPGDLRGLYRWQRGNGTLTRRQRIRFWRARATFAIRDHGGSWLHLDFTGMTSRDRKRWAACLSMADLGETVIAWLEGWIEQTPGHCAPPCDETRPLTPVLTLANRAGFITDNSQLAETDGVSTWNTWVSGFAADDTLARLRAAVAGTGLDLTACRGREHDCQRSRWRGCPSYEDFWAECCPLMADQLHACWYVTIEDPQPGRNDILWPALERFAAQEVAGK